MIKQEVLINMCFSIGINELLKFQDMLAACSWHKWDLAAQEMINSDWYKQVGDRSNELVKQMRRVPKGENSEKA